MNEAQDCWQFVCLDQGSHQVAARLGAAAEGALKEVECGLPGRRMDRPDDAILLESEGTGGIAKGRG
jgi:hypothetical protein